MSNDRVVLADRTSPRQEVQGDHPGSMLSFASGSAIKRITAGVKARRWTVLCESSDLRWGLHPPTKSDSNEKKNTALRCRPRAPLRNIGRFISTSGPVIGNINKEKKDDKAFNFTQNTSMQAFRDSPVM